MRWIFSWLRRCDVNVWVVLAILLLSAVLGVLNNLRVFEEQRVPWPGEDKLDVDGGE